MQEAVTSRARFSIMERVNMRLYHYLPAQWAIEDVKQQRLKIATLDDLNDPFELWSIAQPTRELRQAVRMTKEQMAADRGLLCFSRSWHSPVMWSHYADRHRGICLGFDVSNHVTADVRYTKTQPVLKELNEDIAYTLLFTKFSGWSYEREVRAYVSLDERNLNGKYFYLFGESLRLKQIIAGPLCTITREQIEDAVLGYQDASTIEMIKARLAFRSFRVVKNRQGFRHTDHVRL
jgi:hypothetical protein